MDGASFFGQGRRFFLYFVWGEATEIRHQCVFLNCRMLSWSVFLFTCSFVVWLFISLCAFFHWQVVIIVVFAMTVMNFILTDQLMTQFWQNPRFAFPLLIFSLLIRILLNLFIVLACFALRQFANTGLISFASIGSGLCLLFLVLLHFAVPSNCWFVVAIAAREINMALECLRNTTHCQLIPGAFTTFTATKLAASETSLQQASADMLTQHLGLISSGQTATFEAQLNDHRFVLFCRNYLFCCHVSLIQVWSLWVYWWHDLVCWSISSARGQYRHDPTH